MDAGWRWTIPVYDRIGNVTEIRFRAIRTNEEIPESVFNFEVPAGVEVQDFTPSH